jgi:hypothetical protein
VFSLGPWNAGAAVMSDRKREILAEKFMDIGNYAVTALLFSQLIAERTDWNIAFAAILIWVCVIVVVNVILP